MYPLTSTRDRVVAAILMIDSQDLRVQQIGNRVRGTASEFLHYRYPNPKLPTTSHKRREVHLGIFHANPTS
ncbi:hypothetical protein BDR03DRAFT_970578 [Suillus americanus]|nr:hypothetical protein BDR03DRAFT_970578 [Suillus americanus]